MVLLRPAAPGAFGFFFFSLFFSSAA